MKKVCIDDKLWFIREMDEKNSVESNDLNKRFSYVKPSKFVATKTFWFSFFQPVDQ